MSKSILLVLSVVVLCNQATPVPQFGPPLPFNPFNYVFGNHRPPFMNHFGGIGSGAMASSGAGVGGFTSMYGTPGTNFISSGSNSFGGSFVSSGGGLGTLISSGTNGGFVSTFGNDPGTSFQTFSYNSQQNGDESQATFFINQNGHKMICTKNSETGKMDCKDL